MVEADQRTTQEHERLVDVIAPLVADRKPAELGEPRQSPLNHPPVAAQLLRTLYLLSRYAPLDATFSERPRTLVVVGFVGVKLLGTLSRTAPRAFDGLDRVQKLLEDHRVVDVGGGRHHRERDAPSLDHNMALRPRFSLIRRIRAGLSAPFLAGTLAESKEARSQSIWSASPRRSSRACRRRSHTPASCHSLRRRQQVTPLPQPISWGSISQGMPLFSTKTMPVRAARSSRRGLPPWGLGGSSGKSGSTIFQSSSLTNSLAISLTYPSMAVLKGSLREILDSFDQRGREVESSPCGAKLDRIDAGVRSLAEEGIPALRSEIEALRQLVLDARQGRRNG